MEYFEIENDNNAKIKVIGCGGGGGNAVNNMIQSALKGVKFIAANTDAQDIEKSLAEHRIQLGTQLTKGLGSGGNPDQGRAAALESVEEIREALQGTDMVFITAGMGGGTGTGSAPVVAEVARELGCLTVAVVTKPFYFEGTRRMRQAEKGIDDLADIVDSIITIPNDRLLNNLAKKATFVEMLQRADQVLYYAVKGIADLITVHGLINLDFADVKAAMNCSGMALMGTGIASGDDRAKKAAMDAITSPLLEDITIDGAKGILINITCAPDMLIEEASEAADIIYRAAHPDAEIFFGTVFDPDAGDEMRITVIATGIQKPKVEEEPQLSKAEMQKRMLLGPRGMDKKQPAAPERASAGAPTSENDLRVPAYLRKQRMEMQHEEKPQMHPTAAIADDAEFIFDDDDLEVPAYMRKSAN